MQSVPITERVKALGLPLEQLIVIASGVMDALGLRKSNDIDLVVTKELFMYLEKSGWRKEIRHEDPVLFHEDVEAWQNWGIHGQPIQYDELISRSITIDGVRFSSPDFVLEWKRAANRPKDIEDIKLLERYLYAIK